MIFNYDHLPSWLEKNWLFRKLFLMRKLFLTKKSFRYHSPEGIFIYKQFPKKYEGFYVDVGCFHPVKYNTTYRLYRRGWRGVNIDLDPIKIEGFDMMRPDDVNIVRAVSNRKGTVRYWSQGFYSLRSTLDREFAREQGGYVEKEVEADTLTNILDESSFRDRRIDFLNVDAEGHDIEVLRSLDFDRYRPTLIAVEFHAEGHSEVLESALHRYLTDRDYELINWIGPTLLFRYFPESGEG